MLRNTHAHGDQEHEQPLVDALEWGFTSIEADVHVVEGRGGVGGEVLVAHDVHDLDPTRTLQALYLEPLAANTPYPLQLLLDVKTEAEPSWLVIEDLLARYPDLTVTVLISGNRPLDLMARTPGCRSVLDGRWGEENLDLPATSMPMISDNWVNHFSWDGTGPFPEAERRKLREFVTNVHATGREVRFWNTPDSPGPAREAVWNELLDCGVDRLNTDDLEGLAAFLRGRVRPSVIS